MIDQDRLSRQAIGYGIHLTEAQLGQLNRYSDLLVEWNQKMNLTAITEPQAMEEKHFIDSLLFASQPEVVGSVVDVGSGAGFPGLVAKIYNPSLKVTLMEPTGKRCTFLAAAAEALGLSVTILKERAEEAARKDWRECYDIATARAVASLPVLAEYCLPLVKPGGLFIALKGDVTAELASAEKAIGLLGGKLEETRKFNLPDGALRNLVFVRKISATPSQYPRNGGRIGKKPL